MKVQVRERDLVITEAERLVAQSVNEYTVQFTFDPAWDGYAVEAVFQDQSGVLKAKVISDGAAVIPWEVLQETGYIRIGVFGVNSDHTRPTVWSALIPVYEGAEDGDPSTPTASTPWQEALAQMGEDVEDAAESASAAEAAQAAAEAAAAMAAASSGTATFALNDAGHLIVTWTDTEGTSHNTDIGEVSAYAVAVRNGYTGTEAQWEQYIANASTNAQAAAASALVAEGYADGKQNGTAVESGSDYYHNNAKYYSEQAATSATAAQEAAGTASAAYGTDLLAPNYGDLTPPIAAGQHCIHSGDYYECISPITEAEEWTAAHWKQVTVGGETSDLKSAFDLFGADNRMPDKTGTFYPGSLTVVGNNSVFNISGSPTGSGQTHFDIYNNSSAFPAGISAGMSLQLVQSCPSSKIHFKFYEFVNGSQSMICDIPGNGTAQINVNASATGCIIRISVDNGDTYSNVISSVYIFGTLTKQQTQEQITSNEQAINTVDNKLTAMKAYMPTAGSKQFINVENVQIINARVADSNNKLIADANYSAIVVPANIEAQKTYWAKVFSNNVTLAEIKLYTFNTVEVGTSIAVDVSNSYSTANKQSRTQTTATASYFVLVLRFTDGNITDALNSAVIALSDEAPTEYTPYYVSVDQAIENAIGKKTSPDCVEVGTSADDYVYTNVNTAVSGNPGRIIKINYGTYETEVEDLTTDKKLIGADVDFCVLEKTGGDYDHPPIEIAGGIIKNLTVKMVNNTEAQQFGYCVHSDNSATANKTLIISNCKFDNDLYRVIGMGVRGGETVIFQNCEFIGHGETAGQAIYIHNSSGTKATVKFRNCYFQSVNECLLLQGWGSDCNVDWEFIDCTCISDTYGVGIETVWTDYVSGSTHDQNRLHEFSGKFALLPTSHGNNISVLNYNG